MSEAPPEGAAQVEGGAPEGGAPVEGGALGAPPTLTIDPPAASVPAAGGQSTHQLANPSGVRLAFKVNLLEVKHSCMKQLVTSNIKDMSGSLVFIDA